MAPYTLPVHQTDQQLRQLIERTQQSPQPIIFTKEETDEPLAVLVESSVFEQLQKHERQFFYSRLKELQRHLDRLEEAWLDKHLHSGLISAFQNSAETLWDISPKRLRGLCVTLTMAARRLNAPFLSHEQLAALRYALELLRDEESDETAILQCHRQLIACGLPPTLIGSRQLAKLYEEES